MNKIFKKSFLIVTMSVFMVTSALATKPGEDVNPNGFPSGEHHNLNIIAKKMEFICPDQEYDEYGDPIYGNVIFIPEGGEDIQILMQSGKGKKAAAIPDLQVIDPCAFGGNAAIMQLPKNDLGYRVYARALAKPTYDPFMEITPDLVMVEDDAGNTLFYLGEITPTGLETPYQIIRKKGKSKAQEITPLFEWTGSVCYFTPDGYCEPGIDCDAASLCCIPEVIEESVVYHDCEIKIDDLCPEDTDEVTAYCKEYVNKWVFNIGDFVTYLWDIDHSGLKLLQVRFYPNK
jgi:hypothetical protein